MNHFSKAGVSEVEFQNSVLIFLASFSFNALIVSMHCAMG